MKLNQFKAIPLHLIVVFLVSAMLPQASQAQELQDQKELEKEIKKEQREDQREQAQAEKADREPGKIASLFHRTAKYRNTEEAIDDNELRIVSWNIQMLPRMLWRLSRGPIRRANLIPQHLIDDQADIIVFQECFDARARRILKKKLKETYPYMAGPANRAPMSFKTNSGIVIFSKVPFKELGTVDFKDCQRDNCLARKGALLIEAEWKGVTVQVLGTHLEAGGPRWIKENQYVEIKELIDQFRKDGVPQFICGDFNTNYDDTIMYPKMIKTLGVEDGTFAGDLQFTDDPMLNDMNYRPGKTEADRDVIDYIFYRANGIIPSSMQRYVRQCQQQWCTDYKDLSDHNAVLMRVVFAPSPSNLNVTE